ncbi:biliverdin-producing heme oxygenase [Aureimonas sp. Leaf324]|jgi:heme oxygenase|uniref:biliverdin-producing heme oxygenase n=1 Tax=Aureimonas sp. Leaf324 TaxID=1736336 RepID=UPI000AFF3935|nr:biliverdin-producing heme oxygenase [Aureimonas sp. Leaf324]
MTEKGERNACVSILSDPSEVVDLSATPAPSRAEPSLRDRLRTDTRDAHEALDASFSDMFADASGAQYRRFIAMNREAHEAIEPVLAGSPLGRPGAGGDHADRLDAAQRDAQALGIEPRPASPFPLPRPDIFEAFGIAYVLEGSRLGAKYMLRAINRDERLSGARWPTHYLEASSDARPFTRLLDRMAAEPASEDDMRRATAAADATFRYFRMLCGDDDERTTRA